MKHQATASDTVSAAALAGGRASALSTLELHALLGKAWVDGTATDHVMLQRQLLSPQRPQVLSFVNAHGFNLAVRDAAFRRHLLTSDFVLRDGIGMKIAMAVHGYEPGANLNGTDFIPALLAAAPGRKTAIYGTRTPWLDRGAARLAALGLDVVDTIDGFAETAAYVEAAREARPDIVVLAMGMPKQERVAHHLRNALDFPVLIINGGAIIDFLAGKVARAPSLVRTAGLEWAWRLAGEPRRLARRYLSGGPEFLARIASMRLVQSFERANARLRRNGRAAPAS